MHALREAEAAQHPDIATCTTVHKLKVLGSAKYILSSIKWAQPSDVKEDHRQFVLDNFIHSLHEGIEKLIFYTSSS